MTQRELSARHEAAPEFTLAEGLDDIARHIIGRHLLFCITFIELPGASYGELNQPFPPFQVT
jgi:hypothetical protein